jgi:hypothetical protein
MIESPTNLVEIDVTITNPVSPLKIPWALKDPSMEVFAALSR